MATTWCLRDYSEPILWQFSKHFLFRYTNEHILCIYHIDDIYIYYTYIILMIYDGDEPRPKRWNSLSITSGHLGC